MVGSRGWDWEKADREPWLVPTEDSHYLANRWAGLGFSDVLDLGSGLGRHSILFARHGLRVSAIDASEYGVEYLREWAGKEGLEIGAVVGDMSDLPYGDGSFDCVFAYHSISHGDTNDIIKTIGGMERVLRKGGHVYASMCSKDSMEYLQSGYPRIDENTLLNTDDGPEMNVPHFYANLDDIIALFNGFRLEKVRHVDYCYLGSRKLDCKYYYVYGIKE